MCVKDAFDRRLLRLPQASPGKVLAQTAPTVAFALYSNSQFLVEPDRALVPRAYRQTHSSRHVPECACIDCCHQRLYGPSQPTSSGVCMDGTCRTDSGQSSQKLRCVRRTTLVYRFTNIFALESMLDLMVNNNIKFGTCLKTRKEVKRSIYE